MLIFTLFVLFISSVNSSRSRKYSGHDEEGNYSYGYQVLQPKGAEIFVQEIGDANGKRKGSYGLKENHSRVFVNYITHPKKNSDSKSNEINYQSDPKDIPNALFLTGQLPSDPSYLTQNLPAYSVDFRSSFQDISKLADDSFSESQEMQQPRNNQQGKQKPSYKKYIKPSFAEKNPSTFEFLGKLKKKSDSYSNNFKPKLAYKFSSNKPKFDLDDDYTFSDIESQFSPKSDQNQQENKDIQFTRYKPQANESYLGRRFPIARRRSGGEFEPIWFKHDEADDKFKEKFDNTIKKETHLNEDYTRLIERLASKMLKNKNSDN